MVSFVRRSHFEVRRFAVAGVALASALIVATMGESTLAEGNRLTPEKLWDLRRIGDSAVSPDGKLLAYIVTDYDLAENAGKGTLYVQRLTPTPTAGEQVAAAFETPLVAPEAAAVLEGVSGIGSLAWFNHTSGVKLLYSAPGKPGNCADSETSASEDGDQGEASGDAADGDDSPSGADEEEADEEEADEEEADEEEADEVPQAWLLGLKDDLTIDGEPVQLTYLCDGISNLKPAPSGDAIAFTVDVKMDQAVNEIYADLPKADARIIDSLLYRHWNQWHDYKYSHLHVARINADGKVEAVVDLMDGMKADCPVPPFGGSEQFEFSPDGKEIALTLKLVDRPAESTNTDVYLVDLSGDWANLNVNMKNISPNMPGYDMEPRYSPNGDIVAFHSMERASFESDRNRIMLYDRKRATLREVTSGLDQTAHNATFSPDGSSIYFYSETRGTTQVYSIGVEDSKLTQMSEGRFDFSVVAAIANSDSILVRQQSMLRPAELAIVQPGDGSVTTITDVNGSLYEELELPTVEERFFTATDGKSIHNWVILPPDYDAKSDKKWPMLTYCQGGPQGQIGQWFSYRWNFHLMASRGYVVLAVNRRGLPGFGREWNDQISGDWGGQAMKDILTATDGMLEDKTIDAKRVAAIGASFGGYTVYWLMGNGGDRFCSMIAHCGVYNLESMYGSTEELFFVNWDLGGPYWSSEAIAKKYQEFSPHRFAKNWKTPLLVIHGEKDFRVPVTQGMEAFTAAQVQNVPSRFLYFPEEGHWVMSPQNGVVWGRVFFDWLDTYCK